jgi:hypothetical protein
MSSQPPSGFIHLILLSQEDPLYLEIPTAIVKKVCLKPHKYLRYLGWCILGVIGDVVDEQGNVIALDGDLVDQGVYHYIVPDQNVLAHAVDLEVIKQRTQVPSETTGTPEDFRAKILQRDGYCVWTGMPGVGMHVIPYRRGDEVGSRHSYSGTRAKFCIYCSSGSSISSRTAGHGTKTSTHSRLAISRTAFVVMKVFISITLTHETSSFLKYVHHFFQSNHH